MQGVVNIGPLAMATDRLLAVALVLVFITLMDRVVARAGKEARAANGLALVGGLVAARIGFVLQHLDAFARDWWSAFAFWQGGFSLWAGAITAAAIIAWRMKPRAAMLKGIGVLGLVLALWFTGWSLLRPSPYKLPTLPELVLMDGSVEQPTALTGKPMVINLWATWCAPCRRELPMLVETAAEADIPVLLVNQGEESGTVSRYLRQQGVSHAGIRLDQQGSISHAIGSTALPTTLFVNAEGQVVETHVGEISRAMLLAKIAELEAGD
ncbi:MAG: TlpA family protein disulfide reductase [Sphingomonadaceae bacterium]|nr:TlpA family protein disulfide reductase [Sphingomonadaceae bacterium]